VIARLATFWQGFRHLFMPGICFACHVPLAANRDDFCDNCVARLTTDCLNACPRCSSTVGAFAGEHGPCPKCQNETFGFDRALRLGPYEGLLRELILQMKQPGSEGLAEAVGRCWAADSEHDVRAAGVELVAAVPLHWTRRWKRGFNQCEILARMWAERLRIPLRSHWVRRIRATPMQSSLTPAARRENVKGAFATSRSADFRGRAVLLIDDVMTTGSTASEVARTMRKAGARSVVAAVLGHDH
jgi:ComF family protein